MKSGFFKEHGTTENIMYGDIDTPELGPSDVLIETKFGALNHLDLFVMAGWPGLKLDLPHIMGSDGAGIVKEVGNEVSGVFTGDRVAINPGVGCGTCPLCMSGKENLCFNFYILGEHKNGTFAEYFKIPAKNTLKIPDSFSLETAAAASLTYLTAWRLLTTKGQLEKGQIALIQGAGGGVATAAIQIAKHLGATVIATTSTPEKVAKAKEIGADYVINYRDQPDYGKFVFKELTKKQGVDVILDSVGAQTFGTSMKLLKANGKLVTCGATTGPIAKLNLAAVFWKQLEILGSTMSNQAEFLEVMDLVISGKLKPTIDKVFPLEKVREAEEYLEKGNQFGKVLIQL